MSYVTGISGNVISAASAGFAPTNGADVSAIASAYSESAASGKLDSSASSSFYGVDNPSGFITGVDLSNYATTAYVDSSVSGKLDSSASSSFYTTANESGFVDSSYVDSAVSGKADSSALSSYALSSDVSGVIDTVSSNSASWGGGGATGDYVEKSATAVAIGSANSASYDCFAQGTRNFTTSNSFAQGYENSARYDSFAQGSQNSANLYSFAQGLGNSAINTAVVFGTYNLRGNGDTATGHSAAFVIGNGSYGARHDLMLVTRDGEITMYSSKADTVGTGIMSSIRAISAAATGGGVDSATVSSIASSYAESAASSKMDSSAIDYTRTGDGTQIYASGTGSSTNQFSAKNDSAGAAIIAGENARLRLWDTAATANLYASSIGGWNAASNLVTSQSANWGGSALGLSAGPGVKLEKVGDTLVASTDETVLFSASGYSIGDTAQAIILSESPLNFKTLKIYGYRPLNTSEYGGTFSEEIDIQWLTACSVNKISLPYTMFASNVCYVGSLGLSGISSTTWTEAGWHCGLSNTASVGTTGIYAHVHKIIGINRTAGV